MVKVKEHVYIYHTVESFIHIYTYLSFFFCHESTLKKHIPMQMLSVFQFPNQKKKSERNTYKDGAREIEEKKSETERDRNEIHMKRLHIRA